MISNILLASILTTLLILGLEVFVYVVIVKKIKTIKSDEQTITSTSSNQDIKRYFDVNDYFLKKIDDEATKLVNVRIATDTIAQTASISQDEVVILRDQIIDNVISSTPVPFLQIVDTLYTREQIMLICTNVLVEKLLSYYTIYTLKKGGSNK